MCASPRNSTWFTRLFLLVRGWGLGTRLSLASETRLIVLIPRPEAEEENGSGNGPILCMVVEEQKG